MKSTNANGAFLANRQIANISAYMVRGLKYEVYSIVHSKVQVLHHPAITQQQY